jgi:hypothetical protein
VRSAVKRIGALRLLVAGALQGRPARARVRGPGLKRVDGLLGVTKFRLDGGKPIGGFLAGGPRIVAPGLQLVRLLAQPGQGRGGILVRGTLAAQVPLDLGGCPIELGEAFLGPALFSVEGGAGMDQALEGGGRFGLRPAQGGERVGADRLRLGGLGLRRGALGDGRRGGGALGLRGLDLGSRAGIADEEEQRLQLADLGREIAITYGLTGLAAQTLDLRVEAAQHVLHTNQVVLGAFQPQLRLVAAGMEARDAGRVLEDAAPRLGLRRDQLADLALAHEGGRARAGGGVREQDLHVASPNLPPIDAVVRALLALDAPGDFEEIGVVEGRGRRAACIVGRERHLGDVAGRPVARAREDHVVHAGRAHVLVRALAHDPAKGLDEVRLAAAVGPDDAREPRLDEKLGGLDEGLEPDDAQPRELHGAALPAGGRASRLSRGASTPGWRSSAPGVERRRVTSAEQRVDDLLKFGNRHVSTIDFAVDEEGRRGVDPEALAPVLHVVHGVINLLVLQAGLELFL